MLHYDAIVSLDGYVADRAGNFEALAPDEEVHAFVNDLVRPDGTQLLGRRMYEVLVAWETMETPDPITSDYAELWRSTDKIVYSTTLPSVQSDRTRIERSFDPAAVRELKSSSDRDLGIGGPHLAAEALRAGLVDEIRLFFTPVVFGGGNAALAEDLHLELELMDHRRFGNGVVFVRYGVV
jgi:dihydrofolate reductase